MSSLIPPTGDLARFPRRRLPPSRPLFRIHRADREPWWFSSDGSGRFDLMAPAGTCYLSEDPLGAFIEVFRFTALVPELEVQARHLSTLHVSGSTVLANCTAQRARAFGITAAIHAGADYNLTQSWAAAFASAGFDGVRYLLSHDPSQRCVGIALFGTAGRAARPVDRTEAISSDLIGNVRRHFGIRVLPTPQA